MFGMNAFSFFFFSCVCHSSQLVVILFVVVVVDWECMFTSSVRARRWRRRREDQLSIGRQPQVAAMFYVNAVPGSALFMLFVRDICSSVKNPITKIVVSFVLSLFSRPFLVLGIPLCSWWYYTYENSSFGTFLLHFHSTQSHLDDPPPGHFVSGSWIKKGTRI